MAIKQNPYDLLRQASDIISERGENYGGIEDNFQLIADLASLRLGRDIHPYEIAVMMVCVKNARAFSTPTHIDSRIDAMNYEAFAATFAQDYLDQKTANGTDIGYKKKTELKPATIAKFSLPKSNVEHIKTPKAISEDALRQAMDAVSAELDVVEK